MKYYSKKIPVLNLLKFSDILQKCTTFTQFITLIGYEHSNFIVSLLNFY